MEIAFLLIGGGFLLLVALWFFKELRVMLRGKREIRSALAGQSLVVLEIRGDRVFRDCGSVREAFLSSLSVRDYRVRYRTGDGTEHSMWVGADFHPLSGAFRELRIVDAECEGGEPEESFSGA
jgi:hypothetical protein